MEFTRYRPGAKNLPRLTFTLVGTVLKTTDKSILLKKANANNRFGIDLDGNSFSPAEGETVSLKINISTYHSKEDDLLWTKLRLRSYLHLDNGVQEDHPGFSESIEGKIEEVTPTEIPNLYILKVSTDGEFYTLRYFGEKKPMHRKCTLYLSLRSSSKMVNSRGEIFESTEHLDYVDKDGSKVNKTVKRWFPTFEIAHILYK